MADRPPMTEAEAQAVTLYGLPARGRVDVQARILDGAYSVYCAHDVPIFRSRCERCREETGVEPYTEGELLGDFDVDEIVDDEHERRSGALRWQEEDL